MIFASARGPTLSLGPSGSSLKQQGGLQKDVLTSRVFENVATSCWGLRHKHFLERVRKLMTFWVLHETPLSQLEKLGLVCGNDQPKYVAVMVPQGPGAQP